jgi:hypothetical protein
VKTNRLWYLLIILLIVANAALFIANNIETNYGLEMANKCASGGLFAEVHGEIYLCESIVRFSDGTVYYPPEKLKEVSY